MRLGATVAFLGDYELLEEIARGGMGAVYRARQMSLNRQVAVKVLLGGRFANKTFIERFRREAEAAASLNHPNIVAIHEVGEHEGQPYFSMELIEGRSLADLSRDNPLPARRAAQLLKTISEAVAFAHGRRLLHRDLKPSNVLLDDLDVPHITDFGLAKRSDEDADLTLTGQILGSPNYMAPEQADPRNGPTTAASDVYSLGAMLYHLLTGRPPFMAETVARTLRLVAEGDPVWPRLLHPELSRDLETICLKCMELDPKLRYASAQELADELGCFLRDEPIRARPIGPVAKLARWCRRKPVLALLLVVVAALLLVVAIGSPIALIRIRGEREASDAARQQEALLRIRAEAAEHDAQQQLYAALVEQAHASVRSGEIGQRVRALDAVRRAAAISNSVELRGEALTALALPDLRFERRLPTGSAFTLQLMDPSFESVALCRGNGPVEIRAVSDWRRQATLPASTNLPVYIGWWSADRRYLAVKRDHPPRGESADLEVWEFPNQRRVLLLHDMARDAMSFHPHQPRLITAQVDGGITIWDLENGKQLARFPSSGAPICVEFAPDGERFAAVHESAGRFTVSVHDAATGVRRASHAFTDLVHDLDWHPGGRWLATADAGGMVHLMDIRTGGVRPLGHHKAEAVTTAFSPDGDYLMSGGWEGELICWNVRTMQRSLTIRRQSWNAQWRSDGRECALITDSGIQLHAFERPSQREFAEDLGPRMRHAVFSPDGRWFSASADHALGVWDLNGTGPGALVTGGAEARPAFTADGTELLAGGTHARCSRWRITPATNAAAPPALELVEMLTPEGFTSLSLASNVVAFTGSGGTRVVGLDNMENTATTEAGWVQTSSGVNGISPDGRWLGVYRPFTPFLYVYQLPGLERVAKLAARANVHDFAFSPLGDGVAVSSRSGVEFWSTNAWTRTRVLPNFIDILFSPDGLTWWLSKDFRTAGLYEARTLAPLLPLPAGTLPLALSADGRRLAVSVDARQLQVWDLNEVRDQLGQLGMDWEPGPSTAPQAAR